MFNKGEEKYRDDGCVLHVREGSQHLAAHILTGSYMPVTNKILKNLFPLSISLVNLNEA